MATSPTMRILFSAAYRVAPATVRRKQTARRCGLSDRPPTPCGHVATHWLHGAQVPPAIHSSSQFLPGRNASNKTKSSTTRHSPRKSARNVRAHPQARKRQSRAQPQTAKAFSRRKSGRTNRTRFGCKMRNFLVIDQPWLASRSKLISSGLRQMPRWRNKANYRSLADPEAEPARVLTGSTSESTKR